MGVADALLGSSATIRDATNTRAGTMPRMAEHLSVGRCGPRVWTASDVPGKPRQGRGESAPDAARAANVPTHSCEPVRFCARQRASPLARIDTRCGHALTPFWPHLYPRDVREFPGARFDT